ncbi:TRAP transporter large permease [Pikeienuella sp. HZG-20]|uniref:TRAP transporter large permease n=1 Tax=Paludibacillus litoralis TaxID=3133267 RepID=UPI0030EF5B65
MTIQELFALLFFAFSAVALLTGFPVAFSLGGVSLIFAGIGYSLGLFDPSFLGFYPERIFGIITNEVLVAIPLFVAMGVILERSKVAEELLYSMARLMGKIPGGLGISVTIVGALLAASTGIVGATVVAMGLVSLPLMLRNGYSKPLACGSIASAGTLGQIIPPSTVLILLGDALSPAYQQAQLKAGNFSPEPLSVGDLFAGGLLPGLMLAGLYIVLQLIVAIIWPKSSPPIQRADGDDGAPSWAGLLRALISPLLLIFAVLGSIIAGVATPTEAASVGAVGATFLAGMKCDPRWNRPIMLGLVALVALLILRGFVDLRVTLSDKSVGTWVAIAAACVLSLMTVGSLMISFAKLHAQKLLAPTFQSTVKITSMIFSIMIGAALFSLVFRGMGGDDIVHDFLTGLPGGLIAVTFVVLAVMFVLGFFLDIVEIIYIVVPLVAPVLFFMGAQPIWLGIMMCLILQTSFLTPPFGFSLFYLKGVAPPEIKTTDIYKGIAPFVGIQLLALVMIWIWPGIVTWLPNLMNN